MNVKCWIVGVLSVIPLCVLAQNPICAKRGHIVPYYLNEPPPKISKEIKDYRDSTVVTERLSGIWYEYGVCERCGQRITRAKNVGELKRERLWMDSTKLMIDSTGKVVRKSKR